MDRVDIHGTKVGQIGSGSASLLQRVTQPGQCFSNGDPHSFSSWVKVAFRPPNNLRVGAQGETGNHLLGSFPHDRPGLADNVLNVSNRSFHQQRVVNRCANPYSPFRGHAAGKAQHLGPVGLQREVAALK